jgi:hypothetical protein
MLAALLMAFLLGGAAGTFGGILNQAMLEDVDGRVQQAIADPARAERASLEIGALRSELKDFEKAFGKSSKNLTKIYKDHEADALMMRAELDALDSGWEAAQARALDHRFAIKESMTRDEWRATFQDR